ncbi:restriction endonuclease [Limosilactobacillus fermentum]
MAVAYLKKSPHSDVWMLNEVPEKYEAFPKRDLGVDEWQLVRAVNKLTSARLARSTINSFRLKMGKDYYSSGLLVSSTDQWNRKTLKQHLKIIRNQLLGLGRCNYGTSFNWENFSFAKENNLQRQKKLRASQLCVCY